MNLQQLRVFQEVMLTGSVSQAARNLNKTQPSVSTSISSLEERLGVSLFVRKAGRLHPVPEAQYLLKEGSELLRRVSTVEQTMSRITSLDIGELRIASMPGPSVVYLPSAIAHYAADKHEIKTTLAARSTDVVINLIATQQYDVGLCDIHEDLEKEAGLVSTEIIKYPCVCAIHSDDPLAKKKAISFKDLHQKPMGTLFDNHSSYQQLKVAFDQENLILNSVFSTTSFVPLLTYVESGSACAIVDPITAESYRLSRGPDVKKIVFKPMTSPIMFDLAIIRPAHRPGSLLALDFCQYLQKRLQKLGT